MICNFLRFGGRWEGTYLGDERQGGDLRSSEALIWEEVYLRTFGLLLLGLSCYYFTHVRGSPKILTARATTRVLKFQLKLSLKFQTETYWNLAKISMKFPVKFHSPSSKIEISVKKFWVSWQLKKLAFPT